MRKLTICLLMAVSALSANAQMLKPLFTISPITELTYLNVNQRKDLIDLFEAGHQAAVTNNLTGKSELLLLSDYHLRLRLSPISELDLLLLNPAGSSAPSILLINSLRGALVDSQLNLYSSEWKRSDLSAIITLPEQRQLLRHPDSVEAVQQLVSLVDLLTLDISYLPGEQTLLIAPSFNAPFDDKALTEIKNLLIDSPLRYHWSGQRFELSH